ncbi:hypothetical protein ScPMuIL_005714 [Solemya velum]
MAASIHAAYRSCVKISRINTYEMQSMCGGCRLQSARRLVERTVHTSSPQCQASRTTYQQQQHKKQRWRRLLLTVGAGTLTYCTYRVITSGRPSGRQAQPWQVSLYRKMPLKTISRLWGKFNEMDLPISLRRPLLGLYVWMFGCKLDEAADQELKNYKNLGQFFRRTLKPDVRPVCDKHIMTSPADGRILHFGEVEDGVLEQVKGVTYSLSGFLGPISWQTDKNTDHSSDEDYHIKLNLKPGNKLYHCIIYLAPGDYHRFHSPTDWSVKYRRHFPGELLSVNPGVARWIQGLFNFNERAVYYGDWQHGFFSFTAVGATNVGSIKIYCDEELDTNTGHKHQDGVFYDKCLVDTDTSEIPVKKGEMFGEFNLGSTIVLIFEAPKNFQFTVENDLKVQFGQPLGTCLSTN